MTIDNPRVIEIPDINSNPIVNGFDRPNLSLRVDMFARKDEKMEALLRRVEFADKPGIVYAATHRNAEDIAASLRQVSVDAVCYHGGMKTAARDDGQNRFMAGEVPVMVATSAFGVGVDKPDIRFVYHADASESLDAYCQEIALAGRDGDAAEAVLFYRPQDIGAQSFKTGSGHVDEEALETVFNLLHGSKRAMAREDVAAELKMTPRKLAMVVHTLEEKDAVEVTEDGRLRGRRDKPFEQIREEAMQQQRFHQELLKRRLAGMRTYAECRSCRRACLLRYFGSIIQGPCGNCDRCEEQGVLRKAA